MNVFVLQQLLLPYKTFLLRGASVNILKAINSCEDLGIKLFLTSLNTGLNFCNCCLSGSLKICPGPSLNARWCVSAQIKLYKQLIWWVLLNPMPGRAEVQVRAWLLNQEYNFKWTRNVLHWWLLFFFF